MLNDTACLYRESKSQFVAGKQNRNSLARV